MNIFGNTAAGFSKEVDSAMSTYLRVLLQSLKLQLRKQW